MRKGVLILAIALVLLLNLVSADKAPLIRDLDQEIVACESSALSLKFSVADLDGDQITTEISPSNPFYTRVLSTNPPITELELFSANLTKAQANKIYESTILVSDGSRVDTKKIKIKVLETNNPPKIQHIPVATVDITKTEKFNKKIPFSDEESSNYQDFTFTASDDLDLLELVIDQNGTLSYTPSENHLGVHEVLVCITDDGIESLEGKIGFCTGTDIKSTACQEFQMVITQRNAPPTILLYNASNSSNKILDVEKLIFQLSKYDPDGLYPDTYWYVDNQLKEIISGDSLDTFTYTFGCGVFGQHKIKAVITDGLANDSVEWKFDVVKIPCEENILPLEKIGDGTCEEKWGCSGWGLCQNAQASTQTGSLSLAELTQLQQKCDARQWLTENCGYQIRTCSDINTCNTAKKRPVEIAACYFSLAPSCSDGIQNCHDDTCEFLTDCGGPCSACATCSDGLRNQNEEGIDCGGPCPEQCTLRKETPQENRVLKQSMIGVIVIALLIALIQIFRIAHNKKILEKTQTTRLVVKYEV